MIGAPGGGMIRVEDQLITRLPFSPDNARKIRLRTKHATSRIGKHYMKIKKGDFIYVQEIFATVGHEILIKADMARGERIPSGSHVRGWFPAKEMTQNQAQTWLRATRDSYRQNLHDHSLELLIKEGYVVPENANLEDELDLKIVVASANAWWRELWNSLHRRPGQTYSDNPEVTVIEFEVCESPL